MWLDVQPRIVKSVLLPDARLVHCHGWMPCHRWPALTRSAHKGSRYSWLAGLFQHIILVDVRQLPCTTTFNVWENHSPKVLLVSYMCETIIHKRTAVDKVRQLHPLLPQQLRFIGMFNAHSVFQHHWSWHAQCSFSVPTPLIMACSMLIQCSNTIDHGMFNAHSVFQHHWSWHAQCSFSVPTPLIMACSMLIQCSNTIDHGMLNAHSVLQHHWSWYAQCSFSAPTPLIMACSMLIQCSNTIDHGMLNAHSVFQHIRSWHVQCSFSDPTPYIIDNTQIWTHITIPWQTPDFWWWAWKVWMMVGRNLATPSWPLLLSVWPASCFDLDP